MPIKAKIFGAGSIGNHLANACRQLNWQVTIVDTDPKALVRTKEEIYPGRYGNWDETINLHTLEESPKGNFDVIFIGTGPDFHLKIATQVLREEPPKVLQIEKPLCSPTLEGLKEFMEESKKHPETAIVVGYNHLVAQNTLKAEEIIRQGELKELQTIDCEFRSHWANIFKAHSWLSGPQDTYLGSWQRGGGAGGEHSHGLNLWQHLAHVCDAGRVQEVSAVFDFVKSGGVDYDRLCFMNLITENGLVGKVAQDVVTFSKKKFAALQFVNGMLEWQNDVTKTTDQIIYQKHGEEKQIIELQKTRPEEFVKEVQHIEKILNGEIAIKDSAIRIERAVDTMLVLAAAHRSHREKKTIKVDYDNF